ncbi:3-hydroxyacyl-CoA dehydrogenase NAD-binding domain-containing protein [Pseudomonas sp. NPDC086251]|uniref:3-hydroxyacyl-CoA dehydrogenase NAD-binding domain-containing protein n=1 Tax=Pseudomonas sp. NPDC086251 TaxID=3364431 RepID=UPI0038375A35
MNTLKLDLGADGVAIITINLPDRPVNVFTPTFVSDLQAAVEEVLSNVAIRGAVLTSGKSGFIAGADLKDLVDAFDQGIDAVQASHRFDRENAVMRRIETGGKPFVAALNGLALGGGLELALACHRRLLVDDPKAIVGLPEVTVGLLPAGGGTQRLPRLIGIEKALPLLMEGNTLKPVQALQWGIVDELADATGLLERARRWVLDNPQVTQPWDVKGYRIPDGAGCLAPHATRSFQFGTTLAKAVGAQNYPARLAILSAVFEGTQLPMDKALAVEAKYFGTLLANPVARNLMRTMFINKGAADKLVRRPAAPAKSAVRKLGVVGAGMMGAGIAYVGAAAGVKVMLLDSNADAAARGKDYSRRILDKAVDRGTQTRDKADAILALIEPCADYAAFDGCDLVIEAVFENRDVKASVIGKTEAELSPDAIFASNTSTLPITGLAEYSERPDHFIGLHFFSPVERMPLVEVIVGKKTSEQTIARALDFVGQLRKTPILVNDSPGFYTSRIFSTYTDEGMAMLAEGVNPALIENAARLASAATSPLAVTDEVSLDLQKSVIDQAHRDGLAEKFLRLHARPVVELMNFLGRLGRKSGGGFYEFPQGGKKHLWPGLAEHFPRAALQLDVETVKDRLLYIQALETARCVEEGVLNYAADADLGSILGLGFPSWTGGTLSLIDTLGAQAFVVRCDELANAFGERFRPSAWLRARAERGERFHPRNDAA